MKKSSSSQQKKPKSTDTNKALGLFDHVNHIRKVQGSRYYELLSDADKKSFNHYMILRFLSMDRSSIENVCYISKYFDIIPSENFYKLCVLITQKTNAFFPYIKSKTPKLNEELLEMVSRKFEISQKQATEYCKLFKKTDSGTEELRNICAGYGKTEKEIEKLLNE